MSKAIKSLTFLIVIFLLQIGCTENGSSRPLDPADLGPEGTQLQQPVTQVAEAHADSPAEKKLKAVTSMGQKVIAWLNLVNLHRDEAHRLNLADKTTKNPVPPEKPSITSIPIILEKFSARIADLPPEMQAYLIKDQKPVETPPVPDDVFLKHIRNLNSSYQQALRWIGHEPYFDIYAEQTVYDIRGYYFFKKEVDVEEKLKNFQTLDTEKKQSYQTWLIGLCHNSKINISDCASELVTTIEKQTVLAYYSKYFPQAKKTYQGFFEAEHLRDDLTWDTNKIQLTQNFILPTLTKVAHWLKSNIEDEWKGLQFQLKLNFVPENDFSPFVKFVKGVTPNVSGARQEIITMDPDYSLDDYSTQWTIRHEFGHILGFPDCYLEFYEKQTETMTYYTIEPENLMCAWGGKFQPSQIEQLRKAYP